MCMYGEGESVCLMLYVEGDVISAPLVAPNRSAKNKFQTLFPSSIVYNSKLPEEKGLHYRST